MRWLWLLVLMLMPGGLRANADADDVAAYIALAEQDLRLATIGYRLAAANAPFCIVKQRNPGWLFHSYRQYSDRDAAKAAFVFPTPLALSAVVPGGPADKAGLKAGFGLAEVENSLWFGGELKKHKPSFELVENVNNHLAGKLASEDSLSLSFTNASGEIRRYTIAPPLVCASNFWVDTRNKIDAGADGDGVRLTAGLMAFVPDDNELATVVAHELAHNLLQHRKKLDSLKKRKNSDIRATEIEADRLAIWLMANAGYDPNAAPRYWERLGKKHGHGIFAATTHPSWKQRVEIVQNEIAMINQTPSINGLRDPPLLAALRYQQ